ncbi:GerAB/ArcD/ProY family transporter [Halalkalibacter urbisdiaboli]|uniref:GerAB/ArcD/ProY family transporter n=1 Tax=Halalkalibacter urbisdiaboli TaxID=1960589 RepID=UPI000B42D0B3|nr:GerAB/ArcD/ProY family transporter [Halalkalibacter urbisdiaboli]
MKRRIQISNGMLIAIIINIVYAKSIGVTQGILARQAGGDMWLITIFSTILGLGVMWLMVKIIKRYPDKNIFEHMNVLTGKWGEKLIGLCIFIFFLGAFGTVMITVVYHLHDFFLPDLPIYIFVVLIVGVGIYGIMKGVEVISRLALLGVFSIIILNILLLLGSLDYFTIREFFPVLRNGFFNAVEVTKHHNADWAMAIFMVAILLPMVKEKEKWTKSSRVAMIYSGLLILMWPILEVGVLSPELTGQYLVSCMQMARSAEIGLFIHRYELIMVIFFAMSALIQVMMCLLCGTISVKHLLGMKKINGLFIPVSLIMGGFGYWVVSDHNRAMDLLTYYWPPIAMPITFGVPIVIFLLGLVLKRKGGAKEVSS